MKKEDKELSFKDLSSRLPYHVRVKIWLKDGTTEEGVLDLEHNYADVLLDAFYYNKIIDIKPYLRLMSEMTKEERETYSLFSYARCNDKAFDWLLAHHFDFRGLIGKGLALVAPEGMYNS